MLPPRRSEFYVRRLRAFSTIFSARRSAETLPPKHALVRLAVEKGAHVKRRAERRGRGIDTLDISPVVEQEPQRLV